MFSAPPTEWTLLASFIGGCLIGAAAVALMALSGRIAGITGILGGLLPPSPGADWPWRATFLAGMIAAPAVYYLASGQAIDIVVPASLPTLLIGGAIVGLGVTFGSGCTSGHGVCGLARVSRRSIAAVMTFMAATAATVYITRHVLGG